MARGDNPPRPMGTPFYPRTTRTIAPAHIDARIPQEKAADQVKINAARVANVQNEANIAAQARVAVSRARQANPVHGDTQIDAQGNTWRYDANLGRGVNIGKQGGAPATAGTAGTPATDPNAERVEAYRKNQIAGGAQPDAAQRAAQEFAQSLRSTAPQQPVQQTPQQAEDARVAQAVKDKTSTVPVNYTPKPTATPATPSEDDQAAVGRGYVNADDETRQNREAGAAGYAVKPLPLTPSDDAKYNQTPPAGKIQSFTPEQIAAMKQVGQKAKQMTADLTKPQEPDATMAQNAWANNTAKAMRGDDEQNPAEKESDNDPDDAEGRAKGGKVFAAKGFMPKKPCKMALGGEVTGIVDANSAARGPALGGQFNVPNVAAGGGQGDMQSAQSAVGLLSGLKHLAGRAKGGPASKGPLYKVGEKGPEVFVPHKQTSPPAIIGKNGPQVGTFPEDGTVIPHKTIRDVAKKVAAARPADKPKFRMEAPKNETPAMKIA